MFESTHAQNYVEPKHTNGPFNSRKTKRQHLLLLNSYETDEKSINIFKQLKLLNSAAGQDRVANLHTITTAAEFIKSRPNNKMMNASTELICPH